MAAFQTWSLPMRIILALVLVAFGALSTYAMMQVGYLGILQAGTASVGAWQVLMDLVIMSTVAMAFMWRDAQRGGRSFWPFATITLATGSFGPLLYLLLAPVEGKQSKPTT
jgi:hypothetical protein